MATLLLARGSRSVGGILGGALGGGIGSAIGRQVAGSLFSPPAREGPRLTDLNVQTSSYGTDIPAIFGAMRTAGTVIWSTDLIENRNRRSNGKGRPATIEFSYSASFAVALSSRPAERVGRIWADGNLLRGQAGDFKAETIFRFYNGFGDQPPDPLIASREGIGVTPAHRGFCYAVFEELQLADFGNRIPSLTFELFERSGAVTLCDIVGGLSRGAARCGSDEALAGYAAQGGDVIAALSPIARHFPVWVRPYENQLEFIGWNDPAAASAPAPTPVSVSAASQNGRNLPRPERRRNAGSIPETLALRHFEPARDYQLGVQRSQYSDSGAVAEQIDLPAALTAAAARRLADLQLLQRRRTGLGWSAHILRDETPLRAGDHLIEPDTSDIWQIAEIEHFGLVSRISAQRPVSIMAVETAAADAGRNLQQLDLVAGTTRLMLLDLPAITGQAANAPIVAAAASGTNDGWRGAALSLETPQGLEFLGNTAAPAAIGIGEALPPPHTPHLIDSRGALTLRLVNEQGELAEREFSLADAGAPLFWVDREIIRAGKTEFLGQGRYRLSQLQRGCFGSEGHIRPHPPGQPMLLIEAESLALLNNFAISRGADITVEAQAASDIEPVAARLAVSGEAIVPFAPVHGGAERMPGGGWRIHWIRRGRTDYGWQDGVDQPLDEDREAYQVDLHHGGRVIASWQTAAAERSITPADIAALNLTVNQVVTAQICQIGRFAKSPPLAIQWQI